MEKPKPFFTVLDGIKRAVAGQVECKQQEGLRIRIRIRIRIFIYPQPLQG
jgi:hypothetical protein